MSISDLVIMFFAALGAVSIFIFIYCACADRHDNGSGKEQEKLEGKQPPSKQ